jgi:putative ABC transport system ATP-binding protein
LRGAFRRSVTFMLQISNLSAPGVHTVSFTLATGECVALRGPSGAGKTLLLRAIADLDPNSGDVLLDGVNQKTIPAPVWRRRVGYVPAEPGWWADSVGEHFSDWPAALSLVQRLGLPAGAREWPVARASTGERARLALIRALVAAPAVLLLDEPTAALDTAATAAVEALTAERVSGGLSVLWVTHDAAQAARVAKRALFIEAGEVREMTAA